MIKKNNDELNEPIDLTAVLPKKLEEGGETGANEHQEPGHDPGVFDDETAAGAGE